MKGDSSAGALELTAWEGKHSAASPAQDERGACRRCMASLRTGLLLNTPCAKGTKARTV